MRQIAEIKFDHIDEEENVQSVDIFFTDDDNEEGTVACEVCLDTGKVFYRDNIYRAYDEVKEAIKEIRKTIVIKKPKIVITIADGALETVYSSVDVEVALVDFDTDGETDEERLKQIPYSTTDSRVHTAYANEHTVEPGDVNPERVNQLFEIIRG
tara:strand:+ start:231 stop:695 length:465 start_codon:yes stop_codon:yes gene_type:complete